MLVACFLIRDIAIACECARLPHLFNEPLVVVSSAEQIVVTASSEACAYGLHPGLTVTAARSLCPALIVLSYDRTAYMEAMECVWDLLAVESSIVEPVAPETCFVQMEGRDIIQRTQQLASAVSERIGVPVRVGLAKTKMVAHQAALQSGDDKVLAVPLGDEPLMLTQVPLQALGKLDRKQLQRLQRLGVHTLGDLRRLPAQELHRQFKQMAWLLRRLSHGEDGEQVRALWPPRSFTENICFEEPVADTATIHHSLHWCTERIAGNLVKNWEFCRSLTLAVEAEDGTCIQEKERLASPLDRGEDLYRAVLRLLQRLRLERPLVRIQLTASDLGIGSGVQLVLMDDNEHGRGLPHERRKRLEAALDAIRRRFGFSAIVTASLLRQARRIDLWTHALTRLANEPVQVATDRRGVPVRFFRRGRQYQVREIQNRWKETSWLWNKVLDKTAYRIETDPCGIYELHKVGVEWRLAGISD